MRTVVLAQTLSGHDGLSCLARQFVHALSTPAASAVDVLTFRDVHTAAFHWPARVLVTDSGGRRGEFAWRAWQAAMRGEPAAAVVVLHLHLLPVAWPFAWRKTPLVPVLVGIEAWRPLSWVQRRVLSHAAHAISISDHTAREFRRVNAGSASLAIDVCRPATPALAAPAAANPGRARPFALIVGRMAAEERYKGHDLLIDVWPDILRTAPEARLVVAGAGDDVDRLKARVVEAGLTGAIEFAGAPPPPALARLYHDCAFFVMPSRHEGFGLVFLEAMAAGRPCIGGIGSAEEIIVPGRTGLIVDPARPREVIEAIRTLFQHPDVADRFGEEGQRRAREIFSVERFTNDVLRSVHRLMPAHAAAAC
jgi:glycosyltransferase involved in cell wall biosynthesis